LSLVDKVSVLYLVPFKYVTLNVSTPKITSGADNLLEFYA